MEELKKMRIGINLTDWEYEHLCDIAECYGTTVNCLLSQFIADLTYSDRSCGSDGRCLSNDWLSRSRYNFS